MSRISFAREVEDLGGKGGFPACTGIDARYTQIVANNMSVVHSYFAQDLMRNVNV
jgi:hypothetical protein